MENRNSFAPAPRSVKGEDVTGWSLPEGAIARLGRGSVRDMAFSPDGQYFAVGTNIGLWLYELSTLCPIALWETDRGYIDGVTFSPDGQRIALHRYHEAIRVWGIQNAVCIAEVEFSNKPDRFGLTKPVFSQDGERLVVFNEREYNRKVQVWCPRTGELISETEISSTYDVYPTCFSSDLRLLAGTNYVRDNRMAEFIAVWCVETGEQIARLDWTEERFGRLCFSPCGRFLAAGGSEGRIQVWDVESGSLEETYTKYEDAQMHPYYTPEGGLIAAAASPSQSKIEIWNLEKDEKIDTFENQSDGKFICFSENGTQLAYIDWGEIKIWTKGRSIAQASPTIQGPTRPVTVGSLVLTPDEKTIVATYWGRKAFLWDVSNQGVRHPTEEELPDRTYKVYLSTNGKIFATGRDEDTLKVWAFGRSVPIAEIPFPESELISREALAPTGHRFAAVDRDRNIHVWERPSPSNGGDRRENWEKCAVLIGHPKAIQRLAFSPDGNRLASISIERTALLWDVNTGEQIAEMDLPRPPSQGKRRGRYTDVGVAFSPLGDIIAGGHQGDIVLWDATDGKTLMTLPQPETSQRSIMLCFSPCGRYLASGAWWQSGLQKVPIRLWEVASGKNIATFWGHTTDVQGFAFSQDGTLLVSGGYDGVIYLWNLTPYLQSTRRFSMTEKRLVTPASIGATGDDITTWALPKGAIARFERGGVGDMAFSPDGHHLAVATKIGLWWYEVATMSPVALWEAERGMVSDIAFSPNGKWIAVSNWDKVLKVWDVQRGVGFTEIGLGDFGDSFIFSPDSRWLAIGDRNTGNIELREPETGKIVSTLIGESEKGGVFLPIAFSPDSQLLASTSRDDTNNDAESIVVWSVESGEQVAYLTGHTGYIYRLCFSPCGRFLASGGEEDGTVLIWDVGSWEKIKAYTGYGKSDMIPSYSQEGTLRTAAVSDDSVTVWDLESNEKLYTANSEAPVAFSNGSQLAYQYRPEFLEVWMLGNPNPRRTVQTHISFVDTSESLRFSQDGKTIVAEYRWGSILLWDVESRRARPAIAAEPAAKNQRVYVSSEGELYATSANKNTVKLWKVGSCESPIAEFTCSESVRLSALTPTNNKLASAHEGGNLIVWDVQSGNKLHEFRHPLHASTDDNDQVWKLMFSPDGRVLMSDAEYGPNARLWDVARGEEIHEFPRDKFSDVGTFSPCGRYLAGSAGRSLTLWDVKRRQTLTTLPFLWASEFAYSPCSSYLSCGGEDAEGILLWDLKRHEIYKRLPLPEGCQDVHSLKFSSCGQYLAVGGAWEPGLEKVPICLWEVKSGKQIGIFWGHYTDVQAVAFSSDNKLLASASFDGSILLWDLRFYLSY